MLPTFSLEEPLLLEFRLAAPQDRGARVVVAGRAVMLGRGGGAEGEFDDLRSSRHRILLLQGIQKKRRVSRRQILHDLFLV